MQISSRFTISIHMMACMETFKNQYKITSDFLAGSIQVNPVIIRRILSQLKDAGLVDVKRGTGGAAVAKPLEEITFLDVYRAVDCIEENTLFHFVTHIIGDSGHDKALDKVQAGTQKIEAPQEYKDLTDLSKINASRSIDLFHQSLEDFRGGITEDRRSPDGKYGAGNCKDQHQKETDFVAFHIVQQLFHAAGKIFCFFIGHSSSAHAASVITHDPIPPLKAEMPRSDGKLRRILTVLCGCRYRRSVPHPER